MNSFSFQSDSYNSAFAAPSLPLSDDAFLTGFSSDQRLTKDVVASTRRTGDAAWTLTRDFSQVQADPERLSLNLRPKVGITTPSTIAVRPSDLAYYRLRGRPGRSTTQSGEFDIMLHTGTKRPLPTDTYSVLWDTSSTTGVPGQDDWWGDIPATDIRLALSTDGSPRSLTVVRKADGGSGKLPEGDFDLEHRSEWVAYDTIDPEQPMLGARVIDGPIFLKKESAQVDATTGVPSDHGSFMFFHYPVSTTGK